MADAAPPDGSGAAAAAAAASRRGDLLRTYQPAMAHEIVEEARRRSPEVIAGPAAGTLSARASARPAPAHPRFATQRAPKTPRRGAEATGPCRRRREGVA